MGNLEKLQAKSKQFIDANVWDGEDRSGCKNDCSMFSPDDLQELIDDLIEDLFEEKITKLEKDATRYRYLRESRHFGGSQKYRLEWYLPRRFDGVELGVALDEAIDMEIMK